jgi:hypothetical protein
VVPTWRKAGPARLSAPIALAFSLASHFARRASFMPHPKVASPWCQTQPNRVLWRRTPFCRFPFYSTENGTKYGSRNVKSLASHARGRWFETSRAQSTGPDAGVDLSRTGVASDLAQSIATRPRSYIAARPGSQERGRGHQKECHEPTRPSGHACISLRAWYPYVVPTSRIPPAVLFRLCGFAGLLRVGGTGLEPVTSCL